MYDLFGRDLGETVREPPDHCFKGDKANPQPSRWRQK
jgi:hypothetical protein